MIADKILIGIIVLACLSPVISFIVAAVIVIKHKDDYIP